MKKLALGMLLVGIVGACSSDKPHIVVPDGGVDMGPMECSVLTQMGCNAGEKCTWFHDDASPTPIGHIGCAMAGPAAIGAACTYGAPGATGFDTCVAGAVCVGRTNGTCEAICDHQGGEPKCGTGFGCVRINGLFGPAGSTTPPAGGVCEVSCDPIADNDYDGSGSASIKAGSACGSDVTVGCYGFPSNKGDLTHFICASPAAGPAEGGNPAWDTADRVHRKPLADYEQYLNSCHPGYTIAFDFETTGGMELDCWSFCTPGNAYGTQGTGPVAVPAVQQPSGVGTGQCKNANGGRQGTFGAVPTPVVNGTNGEHCLYSWILEIDASGMLRRSTTSNTLGICYDHSKYTIDIDNDPATPDVPRPPCTTLPALDAMLHDASNEGCMDTAAAGLPAAAVGKSVQVPNWEKFKRNRPQLMVPAFNDDFKMSFSYPQK